jgi:hypothetical protein
LMRKRKQGNDADDQPVDPHLDLIIRRHDDNTTDVGLCETKDLFEVRTEL